MTIKTVEPISVPSCAKFSVIGPRSGTPRVKNGIILHNGTAVIGEAAMLEAWWSARACEFESRPFRREEFSLDEVDMRKPVRYRSPFASPAREVRAWLNNRFRQGRAVRHDRPQQYQSLRADWWRGRTREGEVAVTGRSTVGSEADSYGRLLPLTCGKSIPLFDGDREQPSWSPPCPVGLVWPTTPGSQPGEHQFESGTGYDSNRCYHQWHRLAAR